jgi:surfactin synthase thioesterase subunit
VGESHEPGDSRDAVSCAIAAYGGSTDSEVTPDDLQAWGAHSTGRFQVRIFRGSHFYVKTAGPEFFEALATDLVSRSRVREVPA